MTSSLPAAPCFVWTLLLLSLLCSGPRPAEAQPTSSADTTGEAYVVTVSAGALDRRHTVVSFPMPVAGGAYRLVGEEGRVVPLQVEGQTAWFVLDRLAAGRARTYRMEAAPSAEVARVQAARQGGALDLAVGGAPVLRYWAAPRQPPHPDVDAAYLRGGYVHPVRTPSGRAVTGDYPADHVHHHGLWASWAKTAFDGRTPDFWNMGDETGTVVPIALDTAWSGPVHGGLQARHRYDDLSASEEAPALYERWTVRVYDAGGTAPTPYRVFDLEVEQATATDLPLVLTTYHYGGVALRGPSVWLGGDGVRFLTSEGLGRPAGNETRARWTYMGGPVEGRQAGVAMLGHPANFRAPQPVRIHPEMPYFCYAPPQLGRWSIEPGQPYVARYRFVTFDGAPDPHLLDRLWNDYAYPPAVTVTPLDP